MKIPLFSLESVNLIYFVRHALFMVELLYLEDSYLKEFEAQVVDSGPYFIFLDRTAFYPGGGGQPADRGVIEFTDKKSKVVDMKRENIAHVIDGELPEVGEKIKGIIDWERRYKIMRTHTAVHVLSGVAYQNFGVKITGNQLYEGRARVDLSFDNLSREIIEKIIEDSNSIINEDLKVKAYYLPKEEFMRTPELMRVNPKLYEKYDKIRIVEIENFDAQADGGTHVLSLREIGKIVLEKYESKGRRNKRIYVRVEDD